MEPGAYAGEENDAELEWDYYIHMPYSQQQVGQDEQRDEAVSYYINVYLQFVPMPKTSGHKNIVSTFMNKVYVSGER